MKNPIRTLAISLWLILASLPQAGTAGQNETPPWYEFEVVIFERIAQGAGSTELWPDDPGTPSLLNAIPFDTRGTNTLRNNVPIPYRPLRAEERRLGGVWSTLKGSRNYRPLYHVAWRQQIVDPKQAQLIYISLPPESGGQASPMNPAKLEGTLKIGVNRYLHLETDLLLRRPRGEGMSHGDPYTLRSPFAAYRMQANQRMRSGKLYLLDHPILGMLVQAEKYEPPKPDPLLEPTTINITIPDGGSPPAESVPGE